MKSVNDSRTDFIAAMAALKNDFSSAKSDINDRKKKFNQAINAVKKKIMEYSFYESADCKINNKYKISSSIDEFRKKIEASLEQWAEELQKNEEEICFRDDVGDDSLMIYIYGKVKAGKSSLANYAIYGASNPDPEVIAKNSNVKFEVKVSANPEKQSEIDKLIQEQRKFGVDILEATSAIQICRMDGLTWVDSPGTGSLTGENQALAERYANAADLIIYMTNSAAPARQGDNKALEGLTKFDGANQGAVIVISRCDEEDTDSINGKIVSKTIMKSDKDIEDQKRWVLERAKESGYDNVEILAISVKVAEKTDGMSGGDLGLLFQNLKQIAESDGMKIKQNKPSQNINALVDRICCIDNEKYSIGAISSTVEKLRSDINVFCSDNSKRKKKIISSVSVRILKAIEKLIKKHAGNKNIQAATTELQSECRSIMENEFKAVLEDISSSATKLLNDNIENIRVSCAYEFEDKIRDIRRPIVTSTKGRNSAIGGGVGLALGIGIGFFTGGLGLALAPALASLAGSIAGHCTGDDYSDDNIKTIVLGDNRWEIIRQLERDMNEVISKEADDLFNKIEDIFTKPVERYANHVENELKLLKNKLLTDVYKKGA